MDISVTARGRTYAIRTKLSAMQCFERLSAALHRSGYWETFVAPYYPEELLEQKLTGEVVVDVQITNEGNVAGIWLVSATPDIFSSLATTAIRQWKFEAVAAKIRVVMEFKP